MGRHPLAPTVIGTVYGMNFDHMPELNWVLGYPFALGLMLMVSVVLYTVFNSAAGYNPPSTPCRCLPSGGTVLLGVVVVDLEAASTACRSVSMAATSVSWGAASRKMRQESRISPQAALAIRPATMMAARVSAHTQPVRITTRPAMAVAMNANKSLRMCWNAPSTLRLVRSAPASATWPQR